MAKFSKMTGFKAFQKIFFSTKTSHFTYSVLLSILKATLIHYLYTVTLPGLADWSSFLAVVSITSRCGLRIEARHRNQLIR